MSNNVLKALGQKFTFSIANASAAAVVIAILAGIFDTQKCVADTGTGAVTITHSDKTALVNAGFSTVDAVADDGVILTSVTCTASNTKRTIKQFRDYIQHQGLSVKKLIIQANNPDVFSQEIEITRYTPLTGSMPENLDLNQFYDQYQNQTTKIEIDFEKSGLSLDLLFNTVMLMNIGAGRTVTYTFVF